jgi:hypothetical protein
MFVTAAAGIRVPKELSPRDHIDEGTFVEVPETAYYLRRIADGDLLPVPEPERAAFPDPVAEPLPATPTEESKEFLT